MKNNFLKKIVILIIVGLLFSCQEETIDLNENQQNIKFVLDVHTNNVIEYVDPEILNIMLEDLENSGQKIKASQLKYTYNFKTGTLSNEALNSKLYEENFIEVENYSLKTTSNCNSYRAHVKNLGWLPYQQIAFSSSGGGIAGTTGQRRQMEALNICNPVIRYRAHVQGLGWMPYINGSYLPNNNIGNYTGTVGQGRRMEAVQLIIPSNSNIYGIKTYYRAHVQNYGWMPWVKSGIAGTTGQGRRMEAFQMRRLFF
jgi:uncharacterized protein YjdB